MNKNQKSDAHCAKNRFSTNYHLTVLITIQVFFFPSPGKLCKAFEILHFCNAAVTIMKRHFVFQVMQDGGLCSIWRPVCPDG